LFYNERFCKSPIAREGKFHDQKKPAKSSRVKTDRCHYFQKRRTKLACP